MLSNQYKMFYRSAIICGVVFSALHLEGQAATNSRSRPYNSPQGSELYSPSDWLNDIKSRGSNFPKPTAVQDYWSGVYVGIGYSLNVQNGSDSFSAAVSDATAGLMDQLKPSLLGSTPLGNNIFYSSANMTGIYVTQSVPPENLLITTNAASIAEKSSFSFGNNSLNNTYNVIAGVNWRVLKTKAGGIYAMVFGDWTPSNSTTNTIAEGSSRTDSINVTAQVTLPYGAPLTDMFIGFSGSVTPTPRPGTPGNSGIVSSDGNLSIGNLVVDFEVSADSQFTKREYGGITAGFGFAPDFSSFRIKMPNLMFFVGAGVHFSDMVGQVVSSLTEEFTVQNPTTTVLGSGGKPNQDVTFVNTSVSEPIYNVVSINPIHSGSLLVSPRINAGVDLALTKTFHLRFSYACAFKNRTESTPASATNPVAFNSSFSYVSHYFNVQALVLL